MNEPISFLPRDTEAPAPVKNYDTSTFCFDYESELIFPHDY